MSDTNLTNAPLTAPAPKPRTPAQLFGDRVTKVATESCLSILGEQEGKLAAGRVAMAFRALVARNADVVDCTPESVAACVATSAMTGLYPSPVNPGCYVIPRQRSFRVGDDWKKVRELNWQVSAIGLRTLARAAGYDVRPTVVYANDRLEHAGGYLDELDPTVPRLTRGLAPTLRPGADPLEAIRGVVVVAIDLERQRQIGWGWVPVEAIAERRAGSDAFQRGTKPGAPDRDRQSSWFVWPIGMVEKTAVRYALTGARAIVPVNDTTFTHALETDDRAERVYIEPAPTPAPRQLTASAALDDALGLTPEREPVNADEPPPGEGRYDDGGGK